MKLLMISTDRNIFEEGNAVQSRMAEYGTLVDELHIIVFSVRGGRFKNTDSRPHRLWRSLGGRARFTISKNVWAYPTNSLSRWLYVFDAYRIGKHILSENYQLSTKNLLISCQDPFETGLVGAFLGRRFGVPLHVQIHTDFLSPAFVAQLALNRIRVFLSGFVLPCASGIRVVSERIASSLLKTTNYQLKTVPTVLPIFVDVSHSITIDEEKVSMIRSRFARWQKIVLIVARLESEKNIALALKSFAAVCREIPQTGVVILGKGSEQKKLERLVRELDIVERVAFEGVVADPTPYYAIADAYMCTSVYEGYGMALVEAAMAGKAIVTTDVGIVGDLLIDESSALVCPVGDAPCLTDRLVRVLSDDDLRRTLGSYAHESIMRHAITKAEYLRRMKEGWERCIIRQVEP